MGLGAGARVGGASRRPMCTPLVVGAATGRSASSVSGLKFNAGVELRKKLSEVGFLDQCAELFGLRGTMDD